MTQAFPTMYGLLALGEAGPFPARSQQRWFTHSHGAFRMLGMRGYQEALVEAWMPRHEASDVVRRMQEHGSARVLWGFGNGGRRGRFDAFWDVRVAVTESPAKVSVPAIVGSDDTPPLGTASVDDLHGEDGVIRAYHGPHDPETKWLGGQAGWSRLFGPTKRVRLGYTHTAGAVLAVGHVGATLGVGAPTAAPTLQALRRLASVVMTDLSPSG